MKIYIYILVLMASIMTSCQNKEDFDGIRPDARLEKEISAYYELLSSAPNGWIGHLFPQVGGSYTFKMNFNDKNRVSMVASINMQSAETPIESSYRIRATQVPSLYFDTYSYLHMPSDPDPSINRGTLGRGQYSDFEFSIISVKEDTIRLRGNLHKIELLLVKARPGEDDNYVKNVVKFNQDEMGKFSKMPYYHNELTLDGHKLQIIVNEEIRAVAFRGIGNIDSIDFYSEYSTTQNSIILKRPLVIGNEVYHEIKQLAFDIPNGRITGQFDDQQFQIVSKNSRIAYNKLSAKHMHIQTYQYSSDKGFMQSGDIDYFQSNQMPGFSGFVFIPRRYIDGIDGLYMFFNNGQSFVSAYFNAIISNDGILTIANFLGYNHNVTGTIPTSVSSTITNLMTFMTQSNGFYVYKTGRLSYDWVSIDDPKLWIRFN